jgi:hypothetical protein
MLVRLTSWWDGLFTLDAIDWAWPHCEAKPGSVG